MIDTGSEISIPRRLESWVTEYEAKVAGITDAITAFDAAGTALKAAATIGGVWGEITLNTGHVGTREMELSLRKSAWRHVWQELGMEKIASAKDKENFRTALADPPPFDLDTLKATFGPYIQNPRAAILRGMAEVFAGLDPAYKSHEKMKIGVKGLPKRVILHGLGSFYSHGLDKMRDIINALAAYQGKPLITRAELTAIERGDNGMLLRDGGLAPDPFQSRYEKQNDPKFIEITARGVWLKRFSNGNGHLFFGPEALRDVNLALAEFYGDVLPDCPDWAEGERPEPKHKSTAVSKDLQFYPTPRAVIDQIMRDLCDVRGLRVLEPSCGDGRIMDVLRSAGADVLGCEVDTMRAMMAEAKGHKVIKGNFLELEPKPVFDLVVMNPPFYGRHYAKHVRHALRFIKASDDKWRRNKLVAILPATARYDHGLLDDLSPDWSDLPVGAFAESGTNVCTTIATVRAA